MQGYKQMKLNAYMDPGKPVFFPVGFFCPAVISWHPRVEQDSDGEKGEQYSQQQDWHTGDNWWSKNEWLRILFRRTNWEYTISKMIISKWIMGRSSL